MDPQLAQKIQALMQEVYEAGRRDGGAAMRDAILKAAEVPVSRATQPRLPVISDQEGNARAPRGLLPQVIARAMASKGGMTEQQIVDAVVAIDDRVSPRSVGGQLRRFRDKVYRQEGRKWFLMSGRAAGESSPADLQS